jgi:hypothetical protein
VRRRKVHWGCETSTIDSGDANNAIPAAIGYTFRLLIRWLRILLALILVAIAAPPQSASV